MIRNVLTHIGGIEGFGIISMLIFFGVFIGMLAWVCCLKRERVEADARLPLDSDTPPSTPPNHAHE